MAACEACWTAAYPIARRTGRSQVEVYHELVAQNPVHDGDECPRCGGTDTWVARGEDEEPDLVCRSCRLGT